jgi:hypothetical protein
MLLALFLAGAMCSCKGGQYSSKVSKLHSGMSRTDVVAALGEPYGATGTMMIYYDAGADTALAVQANGGDCRWLLLEVPPSGPSGGFAYYKVRDSSGCAP